MTTEQLKRAQQLAHKAQHKNKLGEWLSWILLWFTLALCGAGSMFLWASIKNSPKATVMIEGPLSQSEKNALLKTVTPHVDGGYFGTNLLKLRDAALTETWVERVTIVRHWPNGIIITAYPAHPIARWGGGRYLSDDGRVYFPFNEPKNAQKLPMMHGVEEYSVDMMHRFSQLNHTFAKANLSVKQLLMTDRKTTVVVFNNGLRVVINNEQYEEKILKLSWLLQQQWKNEIHNIQSIDLRYRSGFSVQFKNAPII